MIGLLRPYPEMKPTGLPWLGDVPVHWGLRRAKRMLKPTEIPVRPDDDIVTCFRDGQVTLRKNRRSSGFMIALLEQGYQGVRVGQLVVHSMDAFAGAIGISDSEGKCTPEYIVCDPREPQTLLTYYAWLLRFVARTKYILAAYPAVRERAPRLRYPDLGELKLPAPPLDEQRQIVRFLDWHGAQTAKLVRAKKKLIALLNEQKQAIIRRAVTHGLDSNAKLKPSGIPWLGDVPDGWQVANLRYLVRCLDGKRIPLNGTQRGSMQGQFPYWGANRVIDHVNAWLFDEALVLLGEDGAPFFEPGRDVAFAVEGKIWVNNHAHVLRCGPRVRPRFLAYALNCVDYKAFIDGSTRDKLTQQSMGGISIQVPVGPEQDAIVAHVDNATSQLVASTNSVQSEISLIQEFRTRLIADAVTGKLDVRAVVTSLPDTAEFEPIDESTEGDDLDETMDDTENEEVAA
jgi:type I restriction enzyme S subunit